MDYTEQDIRDLRASGHWPPADDGTAQETSQEAGKGKPTDAASVPA